ncbi:MAG: S-layer homology domain-containing protein [Clostridia bacterium]|nr:S-layer homology domain-containing protein [Clostridia bacterium]
MKRTISLFFALILCIMILSTPALAAAMPFTDIPAGAWYFDDVKNAYESGLINGKGADTFAPEANMTYAEAIKLAACMHQKYTTGSVTLVVGTPWYQTYVDYAKEKGIITRDYAWDQQATRAGYMEIFAEALPDAALAPINFVQDGAIPDVGLTHVQAKPIYKLYRAGILQGADAEHNCLPAASIRRSEVAAILTRMMDSGKRVRFTLGEPPVALTIAVQPKDVTAGVGDTASFTVQATGGQQPYSYRWEYKSGTSWKTVEGAVAATLNKTLTEAEVNAGLIFRCVVTDALGASVTSSEAKVLKAVAPLVITAQPKDVECAAGDTVQFKVAVSGGKAPYTYQWQLKMGSSYEGIDSGDDFWAAGWDTDTLSAEIFEEDFVNGNTYRCVITDADGNTVTSDAAKPVEKAVVAPLAITAQPQDVTCAEGEKAEFTVQVSGGKAPYTYRWSYTGNDLIGFKQLNSSTDEAQGFDSDTLTVTASLESFSRQRGYRCIVTDAEGATVTSDAAKLIQKALPLTIDTQPTDASCAAGESVTFTVAVIGGVEPYQYRWQYGDKSLGDTFEPANNNSTHAGVDTNTLTVTTDPSFFGYESKYRCVITDANGDTVTTDTVRVTEQKPLSILFQPVDRAAFDGDKVGFAVTVEGGTAPYTYQWQSLHKSSGTWKDITAGPVGFDESEMRFVVTEEILAAVPQFRCVITDAKGAVVISDEAKLTALLAFVAQPADVSCAAGSVATFTAKVQGGTGSYAVEWQYRQGSTWYTANAYGMQYFIDAEGNTELQVKVNAPSDFVVTSYRCIVTDSGGDSVTSDTVKINVH